MNERTIRVTVPEQVWGRLATVADEKHTTIGELLGQSVQVALGMQKGYRKRAEYDAELEAHRVAVIREQRALGKTWPQVAEVLHMSAAQTQVVAKRNGMTKSYGGKTR